MTLEEVVASIDEIRQESDDLAKLETLTEDQEARFDELSESFETLDAERVKLVERAEKTAAIRAAANDPRNVINTASTLEVDPFGEKVPDQRGRDPFNMDELRTITSSTELRERALSAVETGAGFNDRDRETLTEWLDATRGTTTPHGKALARNILTTGSPRYAKEWWNAVRTAISNGVADPDSVAFLTSVSEFTYERAMSLTDAAGGFGVPQQLDPALILTSDGTANSIRQVSRVVQATGDVWTGLSTTHAAWSNDAEAAEVSDDATTFVAPTVAVHKAQVFIPFSVEVQGDYPGLENDLRLIIANGKDDLDSANFTTGTGTGQPFGIVTALDGTASDLSSITTDVFAIGDVYATWGALPAKYRNRATWQGNVLIANLIRQFDTAGGAGMWTTISSGTPDRLLGGVFYENSTMDGVINAAAENNVLVVGDFTNYVIADRVGMTLELVPHLFATANNLPSGQRGLYGWARTGADSVNDGGFRLLNVT